MDFKRASELLQGRNKGRRKIGNNTYLERRDEEAIAIRLHSTDIVTLLPNGDVKLNTGGWRTVTTKARINEHIVPRIWQERGVWYVGENTVFEDGMVICADGTMKGGKPVAEAKKLLKFRSKVQSFARAYTEAFLNDKVPAPGAGDCFYCQLRDSKTGRPLGDVNGDGEHFRSHIEEKYFVPSILRNALKALGASIATTQTVEAIWANKPEHMFWKKDDAHFRSEIQKYVSRYMLKQLGQAA